MGEIWIRSEASAKAIGIRPEILPRRFQCRLATEPDNRTSGAGDLGFFHQGELFVTGRIKDLIIVRGVNRYPQDIEMTVERADRRVRSGATAAFAVDVEGRESLVVVCEVERSRRE